MVKYYKGIDHAEDIRSIVVLFIWFTSVSIFLGIILSYVFHFRWQEGTFIKPLSANKALFLVMPVIALILIFQIIAASFFDTYLLQFFP